eukprot:6186658-Pleurochrysis_carterae.AAC.4
MSKIKKESSHLTQALRLHAHKQKVRAPRTIVHARAHAISPPIVRPSFKLPFPLSLQSSPPLLPSLCSQACIPTLSTPSPPHHLSIFSSPLPLPFLASGPTLAASCMAWKSKNAPASGTRGSPGLLPIDAGELQSVSWRAHAEPSGSVAEQPSDSPGVFIQKNASTSARPVSVVGA